MATMAAPSITLSAAEATAAKSRDASTDTTSSTSKSAEDEISIGHEDLLSAPSTSPSSNSQSLLLSTSDHTYITCNKTRDTANKPPASLLPVHLAIKNDDAPENNTTGERRNILGKSAGKRYNVVSPNSYQSHNPHLWSSSLHNTATTPPPKSNGVLNVVLGATTNDDLHHQQIHYSQDDTLHHHQDENNEEEDKVSKHERMKKQMMQQSYKKHIERLQKERQERQEEQSKSFVPQSSVDAPSFMVKLNDNDENNNSSPSEKNMTTQSLFHSSSELSSSPSSFAQDIPNNDNTTTNIEPKPSFASSASDTSSSKNDDKSGMSGCSSDTIPCANQTPAKMTNKDCGEKEKEFEMEEEELSENQEKSGNDEESNDPPPPHSHAYRNVSPLLFNNKIEHNNTSLKTPPFKAKRRNIVPLHTTTTAIETTSEGDGVFGETQLSPITPSSPHDNDYNAEEYDDIRRDKYRSIPPPPILPHQINNGSYQNYNTAGPPPPPQDKPPLEQSRTIHEGTTLHAQSLILALAFFAIWSPQNLMAPNLTQMATYFNFGPTQRDLYLGANIAFATGVLSLPVSAMIGFLADVVASRKKLYAATVFVGGVASICTGLSTNYSMLYFARFACGGCMSGAVPVAFSLLGDLFDTKDRNAASSGLTAMMGAGIIAGQVYAGVVGDDKGWQFPFYVSGALSFMCAILVMRFVDEPVRGGKEKVLQDMIAKGTRYDRKLTLGGFIHAMCKNQSNFIIMIQGFFSSVPWGIIFVFLNDYLSQEQKLSVTDATMLVLVFGIGCAVGGVLGGYWGQLSMNINRSYLPLFMAVTTFLGIFPFLGLLDASFASASFLPCLYAFLGGCIESLPSVNVRPCLINVNPPETRGAALTAANLIINLARGAGPSFVTMMGAIWGVDRQFSFNVLLIVFWTITAIQLALLAFTLPHDQDKMEAELAVYAENAIRAASGDETTLNHSVNCGGSTMSIQNGYDDDTDANTFECDESIVSIEDRMTSYDAIAARETVMFMGDAIREVGEELRHGRGLRGIVACGAGRSDDDSSSNNDMERAYDESDSQIWNEETPLIKNTGGSFVIGARGNHQRGISPLGSDQRRALWQGCPDGAKGTEEVNNDSDPNLVYKPTKRPHSGDSSSDDLQTTTPPLPVFVERGQQSLVSVLDDSQVGTLWEVDDDDYEGDVDRVEEEDDETNENEHQIEEFNGLVTL